MHCVNCIVSGSHEDYNAILIVFYYFFSDFEISVQHNVAVYYQIHELRFIRVLLQRTVIFKKLLSKQRTQYNDICYYVIFDA